MVEKTNGDAGAKWPYPEYKNQVVDCTKPVDTSRVKGQSVIITGGEAIQQCAGASIGMTDILEQVPVAWESRQSEHSLQLG